MFGIGPMELIVIAIVAMVFIGPEKLPDLMRKFGKIFVQVRRQTNEVRSSFNDVIHEAERDFELEKIRELQQKLQSTSPNQLLDAALNGQQTSNTYPLPGPGLDADGHPLPGYDEHGHPLNKDGVAHAETHEAQSPHDYHEGHYVDGKYVANSDTFLAWNPSMDKPLSELFPLKPEGDAAAAPSPGTNLPPIAAEGASSTPSVVKPETVTQVPIPSTEPKKT